MNIVLLGGGGYVGRVLAEQFVAAQHRVRIVDLFGFSSMAEIGARMEAVIGDTRKLQAAHLADADIVFDLAAISNDPAGELDPALTEEINAKARVRAAALAKSVGAKRYVLFSSCSVYGANDDLVDETSALNPLTAYATANVHAEQGVRKLADEDFCVSVFRLGTVFGVSPSMRFDLVVNIMVLHAFETGRLTVTGGGAQYRPLVHVADIGRAADWLTVAPVDVINGEIFNISQANLRMSEVADRVVEGVSRPVELVIDDSTIDYRNYRVSTEKARLRLGFTATHSVESGSRRIYEALESGKLLWSPSCVRLNGYREMIARMAS